MVRTGCTPCINYSTCLHNAIPRDLVTLQRPSCFSCTVIKIQVASLSNKSFKCNQNSLFWKLYLQIHTITLSSFSSSTRITKGLYWKISCFLLVVTTSLDPRQRIPWRKKKTFTQKSFSLVGYLMSRVSIFRFTRTPPVREISTGSRRNSRWLPPFTCSPPTCHADTWSFGRNRPRATPHTWRTGIHGGCSSDSCRRSSSCPLWTRLTSCTTVR